MLRIVSAAVAATLFGFTGLASAQTAGYPYSTDRSITAPSNRGYEQNYRYDQNYRSTPNSRWGAGRTGSSTASNTMHDRDYGAARNNNQFASEAEARSNCRGDTVVWVNTKSHVYHFAGSHSYGNTKHGAFMCRADADRSGAYRAAKNELHMQQNSDRGFAPQSGSGLHR
jgi:hypothetical protein